MEKEDASIIRQFSPINDLLYEMEHNVSGECICGIMMSPYLFIIAVKMSSAECYIVFYILHLQEELTALPPVLSPSQGRGQLRVSSSPLLLLLGSRGNFSSLLANLCSWGR